MESESEPAKEVITVIDKHWGERYKVVVVMA